jgi:hypothetical protein
MIDISSSTNMATGEVTITGIENAPTRKELPKSYFNHVPYMYWDEDYQYIFINYIGGLDYVSIGKVYANEEDYRRLIRRIEDCEAKLNIIQGTTEKQGNILANIIRISGNITTTAIDTVDGYATITQSKSTINKYLEEIKNHLNNL